MASTSASKRQPCQMTPSLPVESNVATSLYRKPPVHQASIRFPFPNQPSSSQRKLINNNNRINSNKRYCIPIISLHPILSPLLPHPPGISPGIGGKLTPHQSPYTRHQINQSALNTHITSCIAAAECGLGYCVGPSNCLFVSTRWDLRRARVVGGKR